MRTPSKLLIHNKFFLPEPRNTTPEPRNPNYKTSSLRQILTGDLVAGIG
jgi:hypothetical protein